MCSRLPFEPSFASSSGDVEPLALSSGEVQMVPASPQAVPVSGAIAPPDAWYMDEPIFMQEAPAVVHRSILPVDPMQEDAATSFATTIDLTFKLITTIGFAEHSNSRTQPRPNLLEMLVLLGGRPAAVVLLATVIGISEPASAFLLFTKGRCISSQA